MPVDRVQAEVKKTCKGEAFGCTQTEKGEPDTKAWGVREDLRWKKLTEPAQLLSPVSPALQETEPKHTGEEAGGASSRCDLAWSASRMGGPGHSHWRCTGPRLLEHQRGRARAVSESPAQSAAEVAGPSRRSVPRRDLPSVGPQLVVHRLQDAIFFGYNFVDCPSRVERRNVCEAGACPE